ncbi:MAG: hypothetical protein EPN79_02230 [Burkholderiaceae bacterium]|nr:MAG: hypothetical protein EPN79_02230 [Burkholderiaceae bacterium]
MSLSIVSKHPIGKRPPKAPVPVNQDDAHALGRWWDGLATDAEKDRVLLLLDRLHAFSSWLACGCTGESVNPPLLAVTRRTGADGIGLSLRRLMDRAAHSADCRFAFEQRERHGVRHEASEGVGEASRPDFLFQPATGLGASNESESTRNSADEHTNRSHPLARRMFWLLNEAGVNTWPRPYDGSDRDALLRLAKEVELAHGLFLRDVLYCHPLAWRQGWMGAGFRKCMTHGLKPQVWWLCEIEHASQKTGVVRLAGAKEDTVIAGKLSVFGGDDSAVRYPMLMCAVVGKLPDDSVQVLQAYAHPIQALDWWLPVDSNLERDAVDDLLEVIRKLARERVELQMLKPLFAWNETGARPDFVVTRRAEPSDSLVVETMGSDDLEYRERKARTVERLRKYPLFEDERARDPAGARAKLRNAVDHWAHGGR